MTPHRRARSVGTRLVLLYVVIVTALLAAFGAFDHYKSRESLMQQQQSQAMAALSRLGDSLPSALWDLDEKQMQKILQAEMRAEFVEGLFVVKDGKPILGFKRGAGDKVVSATEPPTGMVSQGVELSHDDAGKRQPLGTLTLYYSEAPVQALLRQQMLQRIVQIMVLNAALIVALVLGLRAVVLRPLQMVRDALGAIIGQGEVDLTKRLPPQGSIEFAGLTNDLNDFVARLEGMVADVRLRAEEVAGGTGEFTQGNNDLSQRTELQSARVQQASAAVEQITSSVATNATSATEAHSRAVQANAVVQRGGQLMDGVVATMQSIADSSRRVTEIVGVIDSIAFQTNILALNAAVEAARAGEQGRGFAVVASEVRTLAKRCADAAREIKTLIAQSAVRVEEGASRVNEAGTTMHQIVQAIQAVSEQVEQISRATVEQRQSIGEISRSISSIDDDAQQNIALVEQSAATAATLSQAATGLVKLVAAFRVGARTTGWQP